MHKATSTIFTKKWLKIFTTGFSQSPQKYLVYKSCHGNHYAVAMATVGYWLPWQSDLDNQYIWEQVMHAPGKFSKNRYHNKKVTNEHPI